MGITNWIQVGDDHSFKVTVRLNNSPFEEMTIKMNCLLKSLVFSFRY